MAGEEEKPWYEKAWDSAVGVWNSVTGSAPTTPAKPKEAVVAHITIHRVDDTNDKGRSGDQTVDVKVSCPQTIEEARERDLYTFVYAEQELEKRHLTGEEAYCMPRENIDRFFRAVRDPEFMQRVFAEDPGVGDWVKQRVKAEHELHVRGQMLADDDIELFTRILDNPEMRRAAQLSDQDVAQLKRMAHQGLRCSTPEQARERNALADKMGAAGMMGASRAASMLDTLDDDFFSAFSQSAKIAIDAQQLGEDIRRNPHNVMYAVTEITTIEDACHLGAPPLNNGKSRTTSGNGRE